jgi:DNA-binding transcriptional MerR regulator
MKMKTTLDYALDYYHKSFSVIPVINKDKKPAIRSWELNKNTRADEKQIQQWFSNNGSNNNIAIVTGCISRVIAFDIDGDAAKEHFYRIVEGLDDDSLKNIIHNTTTMRTGSGNTNIIVGFNPEDFQQGEQIKNAVLWHSNDDKHNEIRLKAAGGYIVAPPSIHPNGNSYELLNGMSPVVLSKTQLNKLIPSLRNGHKVEQSSSYVGNKSTIYQLDDEAVVNLVSTLKPHYRCGERNDLVLYLSGWLRKKGVTIEHTQKVIESLSDGDEEKQNRIRTLHETYAKDNLSNIKGYSGLLVLLTEQLQDEQKACDTLKRIEKIFPDKDEKDEKEDMLQLVNKNCSEFFLDQYGFPYAVVRLSDHVETMSINGKRFRNWVCKTKYDVTKALLSSETLTSVLNILKAKAEFENNTRNLHLRVAESDREPYVIYYDLTNSKWEVVKITADGWSIEKSPIMFRRYSNQRTQPYPSVQYPSDIFDKFLKLLNVKDEDNKLLLKCYIISLFIPETPKPILMLHGEQGSAKSTLQEMIKLLVDCSIVRTLSFPRDINELIQKLHHNYIAYFDNISVIPGWISDELCRAVTRSGFTKRQLYTDDDDIIYNFKRCIGFNGINLGATKADLLDRGLIIHLERIPKEKVRKLEDIWHDFDKMKTQLLGYILDTLAKVLQVKKSQGGIELQGHPRMADFAEIAEIISRCMGYPENKFLETYYKNIGLQTEEALEANPVGMTVRTFMDSRMNLLCRGCYNSSSILEFVKNEMEMTRWYRGTFSGLLKELEIVAQRLNINTRSKQWPKSPNYLSRRLNEVRTNLREVGITVERFTDASRNPDW